MITSTANEQIKAIRKLRDRKYRNESGTFYIEGIRIVLEALEKPERVKTILYAPELMQSEVAEKAVKNAAAGGTRVLEISQSVFESFSLKEGPMGLAAIVAQNLKPISEFRNSKTGLWVGLDSVADPGNLGTIMRTMDAAGADGIILVDHCTDPYDPSAIRASMGAVFSLQIIKTTTEEFLNWKASSEILAFGTSDSAETDYQSLQYPENMILMMGSERQGLQKSLVEACASMVSIPMAGKSDSLNLAVATGVMLYEIYGQRRKAGAA